MNIMTVVPHEGFTSKIIGDIKRVYHDEQDKKICYISVNKPHKSLMLNFKENEFDLERLFVIDAITRTVIRQPEKNTNCVFVSSPIAFTELLATVDVLLTKDAYSAVVFDNLSTLLVYSSMDETIKFLHTLSTRLAMSQCEGIFICLKESMNDNVLSSLQIVMDRVIHLD